MGISSIIFGMISSGTSIAFKVEDLIKISPDSSLQTTLLFINSIFAPIIERIFNSPFLVGFSPTFFINTSDSCAINAATIIKDADEKSPTIS